MDDYVPASLSLTEEKVFVCVRAQREREGGREVGVNIHSDIQL